MKQSKSHRHLPVYPTIFSADYKLVASVLFFIIVNVFVFPFWIYIADEISYVSQTLTILQSHVLTNIDVILNGNSGSFEIANYPMGTAFFYAPAMWAFGLKGAYVTNILLVSSSVFLLRKAILLLNNARAGLGTYVLSCVPILFFARTIMSEIPSLFIISLAFYLYFSGFYKAKFIFGFGLLAGLSVWFRELNILLFLIPLIQIIVRQPKMWHVVLGGILMGLIPRLLSAWYYFGDALYVKSPGYGFSIEHISHNLTLYPIILVMLFPGFLYFVLHIRTTRQRVLNGSVILYLFFHLIYGYNGFDASGWKALLLSGRFIIPALPLALISFSIIQKNWITKAAAIMPWAAICGMTCFFGVVYFVEKPAKQFSKYIKNDIHQGGTLYANLQEVEAIEIALPIALNSRLKIKDIDNMQSQETESNQNRYVLHVNRIENENRQIKQRLNDHRFNPEYINLETELAYRFMTPYQEIEIYRLK